MRTRALAPFAGLAIAIVVASTAAVLATVRTDPRVPAPTPSAAPAANATARAVPELSKTGRLAYWREGRLWVSGLDGSLRRAVTQIDDMRRVSVTRWSIDGAMVSFIDAGVSVVVVRVDGTRFDIDLPMELLNNSYRIVDQRWSLDSKRIAATFLRSGDGRADAYITDVTAVLPTWTRVTQMEDLFAGDWISERELLAHTAGGVIAVVDTAGLNKVRTLTGSRGASPIVAPDGRIHFLVGNTPNTRDPSLPYITASRASVWSAAADGSDVRRETTAELNDIRLDARLPDGRYLVHRGSSNAQQYTVEDVENIPTNAGIVERMRVAPDGRIAYGFTRERIVRLDLSKLLVKPPASPTANVSVFLDTSGEADVWFPSNVAIVRGATRTTGAPAARYTFALGGHVWWTNPDGVPVLLRQSPPLRRTNLALPRWSPTGEHLIGFEQAGSAFPTTANVAFVVDKNGEATRLGTTVGVARSFAWAPSGTELAVVVDARGVSGTASDARLEVRFMDPSGRTTRPALAGSEVAWTSRGLLVMREAAGAHVIQLIDGDAPARTLIERQRLVTDPRTGVGTTATGSWSGLEATPDGAFASVRLQTQTTAGATQNLFVIIDANGSPIAYLRGDNLADNVWAPTKPLLGYTVDLRTATERAYVMSGLVPGLTTPPVTRMIEGRFAGWSPDADWFYIAKTTGLYAYPTSGGDPVLVGPFGLPISTTKVR